MFVVEKKIEATNISGSKKHSLNPSKPWLYQYSTIVQINQTLNHLSEKKIQLDANRSNVWAQNTITDSGSNIIEADDPCTLPKACKNDKGESVWYKDDNTKEYTNENTSKLNGNS